MRTFPSKGNVLVAGHRGNMDYVPENTMRSFESAWRAGADMIETDLRQTKDGHIVLMHDHTVDRTTNGTGAVREKTLEEIRQLNAGSVDEFLPVPTFAQFLEFLAKTDMLVNLEFKDYYDGTNGAAVQAYVDKAMAMVEEYGLGERAMINSFDAYILEYAAERWGKKYPIHGFYPYEALRNVQRDPTEYLYCACVFEFENAEYCQFLLEKGIQPWMGGNVRTPEEFEISLKNGGMLFTSNDPAEAIRILRSLGAHA